MLFISLLIPLTFLSVDRFANARLEDLAGDILNLCKYRQLDDIYLKIDALQQYIKVVNI